MLSLTDSIKDLHEFFGSDTNGLGLHKVRLDRFSLRQDPRVDDFYVETGTVYGEVTIRIKQSTAIGGKMMTIRCLTPEHVELVKARVADAVQAEVDDGPA